ncbi:beta subunit of N-acylethanolamine-hydrolyzing acid amidase-domain-containing protein [Thermoascus aurantiacus ATCC 26904]
MTTRPVVPDSFGDIPPVYKIDLSRPPSLRYVELATLYRDQLRSLTALFDALVRAIYPTIPLGLVRGLARLCLRRLYTAEETEEIRGISRATGIEMYLLVSFNVLLDLLMGCTSGGVRVKAGEDMQTKMLHFRTLDWGMDALRSLLVQLEYIRSPETEKVLATSITYVGFVGVLTGVRKTLSVSLNFRPTHNASSWSANCSFYFNHLLVLLGVRRSISSLLRQCIMPAPPRQSDRSSRSLSWYRRRSSPSESQPPSLAYIEAYFPSLPTTAAYLIFSDGASTVTMEKDYRTAVVRSSSAFIVATNNDLEPDAPPTEEVAEGKRQSHAGLGVISGEIESVADIIEDSNLRRECMQANWDKKVRKAERARRRDHDVSQGIQHRHDPAKRTRASARMTEDELDQKSNRPLSTDDTVKSKGDASNDVDPGDVAATDCEAIQWLSTYPVTNETTHFAVIMDPTEGKVAWVRRYLEPYVP